jgi:hypothetical protein
MKNVMLKTPCKTHKNGPSKAAAVCSATTLLFRPQNSIDSTVTLGYGLDDHGSILDKGIDLSLLHNAQTDSVVLPAFHPLSTGVLSSGVIGPWREADYLPPCSAEVKDVCSYTSVSETVPS